MAELAGLVLVHCQVGFLEGSGGAEPVHDAGPILERLVGLLERARAAGAPVVFLEEVSEPETDGPIHPALAPGPGEVVVPTQGPDVFGAPHLEGVLEALGVRHMVVAGFQTEVCMDGLVTGALEQGLAVTVVGDAHSTWDAESPASEVVAEHNSRFAAAATVVDAAGVAF